MKNPIHSRAFERWAPFIARIVFGANFLFAAYGKLPGTRQFAFSVNYTAAHHVPFATVAVLLALVLEIVTGVALVVGWQTRTMAAILVPYVLLLGAIFYHNFADPVAFGFFVTHLTLAAGLLYVAAYGAKSFAIAKD